MTPITPGSTVSIPMSHKRNGKPYRRNGVVMSIRGSNALVAVPKRKPQFVALKDCVVVEVK